MVSTETAEVAPNIAAISRRDWRRPVYMCREGSCSLLATRNYVHDMVSRGSIDRGFQHTRNDWKPKSDGTGDFANWASILSTTTDPSTLPFTTTFFIPTNEALSNYSNPNPSTITAATPDFNPFIFAYHIVPQRLTFSELQLLRLNSRLPTLLPNKSIIITNNSSSNFTIDASRITHPDLYLTAAVSVHGIGGLLDYATYGNEPNSQLPDTSPESATSRPPLPPPPPTTVTGEIVGIERSEALKATNSTKMYRFLCLFAFLL